jgi:hypothetical protein
MIVFKNPRDVSQIMALAHKMYLRKDEILFWKPTLQQLLNPTVI